MKGESSGVTPESHDFSRGRNVNAMGICFVDTETTGLDPRVWRTGLAQCRAALAHPAAYRAAAERREAIAAVKAALKPA